MKRVSTPLLLTLAVIAGVCVVAMLGAHHASAATPLITQDDLGSNAGEGFGFIMTKIMSLFAWLLGVAAVALNWAVFYTVVTMGNYIRELSAIGLTWTILRDIANIVIIFGFLAAGISIILNSERFPYGRRTLLTLLVVAIFINFSLFVAEAVIDVGNLFATQFYTQIVGGTLPTDMSTLTPSNEGISNKIMNQLGFTTQYGQARNDPELFKHSFTIGFMGILLYLVATFVMFSLAFILIARFVVLIFLIIISPVGFAGLVIPKLESAAQKWWTELFTQTITAPVLLLLLYIALRVIVDPGFLIPGVKNWMGTQNRDLVGFANIFFSFLVAMGLLYAVVFVSKQMSTFAGNATKKWMGIGASRAVGFGLGTTAFAARRTLGAGSRMAAQSIRRSSIAGTRAGRLLATTFDRGAKGSFDLRGSKIASSALKGIGINAGTAQKGGYQARFDAKVKAHEAYAKSIEDANKEKGPSKEDYAEVEKRRASVAALKKEAETKRDVVKAKHDAAKAQNDKNDAEFQRINEIYNSNRERGIHDPQNISDLNRAIQNLGESGNGLNNAAKELAKVEDEVKTKKEEYEKEYKITEKNKTGQTFEDAVEEEMKERIKKEKTRYAEKTAPGFTSWVLFGPGGSVASRKIKLSLKDKSAKDKALDEVKKMLKEEEESAGKEEKEGSGEKPAEPEAEKPKEATT